MTRKQNKIQGVVSDEMLAQWQHWKQEQGFKSDGQALNALLNQFFSSGDTDITSDKATRETDKQIKEIQETLSNQGDKVRTLENRIRELENRLSQNITSDRKAETAKNTGDDNELSPVITVDTQDENRDRATETPVETTERTYSASELADHFGIASRTLRDHLSKLKLGEVYNRKGEQWKLIVKEPRYQLKRVSDETEQETAEDNTSDSS